MKLGLKFGSLPAFGRRLGVVWLCIAGSLAVAPEIAGKDFVVNSTVDAADVSPGDGVCAALVDRGTACTLRAAIQEANALAGADTIIVPQGTYTLTIGGAGEDQAATGDLDIRDSVKLLGAGPELTIINGNQLDRVFEIGFNVIASICDVTIQNGAAVETENGGGINVLSGARLHVSNATVKSNSANEGGGIWSVKADVEVIQSTLAENSASAVGGGIFVGNSSQVRITRSTIQGNSANDNGGGISVVGALSIIDSTISNNSALGSPDSAGSGGGLHNGTNANTTIIRSTFSSNLAGTGGGIANLGSLTGTNSTISGNTVPPPTITGGGGNGGGLFNAGSGVLNLLNVTITNNSACDSCFHVFGGGLSNLKPGIAFLRNTIVAKNPGGDCATILAAAPITSLGGNLESDGRCNFGNPSDVLADPKLGPLSDNGGPTQTHALDPASPAINAATNCPVTDQRHLLRSNPTCDIGAYEKGVFPDLAVEKTVNCDVVKQGSLLTYQVQAANFGPGRADGVVLTDVLQEGLQVVSFRASQGVCRTAASVGGSVVVCEVGSLPPDGTVQLTVQAIALAAAGDLLNFVVASSPVPERILSNNVSRVTTRVLPGSAR